jgi:hypothetical protein
MLEIFRESPSISTGDVFEEYLVANTCQGGLTSAGDIVGSWRAANSARNRRARAALNSEQIGNIQ